MSQRTQEEIEADQAVHAASHKAHEARDEADRKKSRADARQPKRLYGSVPGMRRSDSVVIAPKEKS